MNNQTDLKTPGVAKRVAKQIKEDIDEYCAKTYDDGHRTHLGASLIGDECKRKLWYIFRWCKKENFSGRVQRLFNRGHKEEDRFIEWLEGIGCEVWADDLDNNTLWFHAESDSYILLPSDVEHPENDVEGLCTPVSTNDKKLLKEHIAHAKLQGVKFPQYRISACGGHFGGSLDLIIILPERYGIKEPILGEIKTSAEKGFTKLVSKLMIVEKPLHFAQTSTYGGEFGFNWVLYLCINKNNDEIHAELVELDHNLGKQMKLKAESIITSEIAPPKLSSNATFFKCKFCAFADICHKGAIPEKNCRSCTNAVPAENANWICKINGQIIPKDFIPKGCDRDYKAITQNV